VTFPDEAPGFLYEVKAGHFWFTHRRRAIGEAARACLAGRLPARILDLGCGDGEVLVELSKVSPAIGLDPRLNDLSLAQRRGARRLVNAPGDRPPFARSFDLAGLFDVVEHVEDDTGLLARACSLVVPGGWVLLTVPADPKLWSKYDRYAGHYRRYSRPALQELLLRAGLEQIRILPLFRVLWPLARIQSRIQRNDSVTDPAREYRVGKLANLILRSALAIERAVMRGSDRIGGTSWLAIARVPSSTRPRVP
jgi:SAM-dependent methyltransferase